MAYIEVLRLGHRPSRDKRVTTHVALTARAFGATKLLVSARDPGLERTVQQVTERFGGDFEVQTDVAWRRYIEEFEGQVVHLTMYGMHIDDALPRITADRVLFVVGAEKVPAELYQLADINMAVGNQPHSEVAALAVALDRLTQREGLRRDLGGSMRIIPMERGKKVVQDSG